MFEPCRRPRPYEHGDEQASACVYLAERFSAAAVTSAGTELFIAQCNALFDRAVNVPAYFACVAATASRIEFDAAIKLVQETVEDASTPAYFTVW